ncbi:uncharacterized protein LOC141714861 [Apium graveolens]|uniref:uncharacterized protein LOC141714861 n=1 Tax=Apium graveolens TaxID=4045 RepID=UPI003D798839
MTDNVLIGFELIHHMNNKKRGAVGEVALKLDISKAYDRVNWSFLRKNNAGLSNAINEASNSGTIHGFKISTTAPTISHLLFTDDSFLFFQASTEEARSIKNLLINYEKCSGQSINFQKSGVFFSTNVTRDKRAEISQILEVHVDITNTKYLGLPSLVGRSRKIMFNYLKENANKRIRGWQTKPMSQGGKTVLIRNVGQAIPSYTMSCFLLPISLCNELEQMYNNYWWRTGKALLWNVGIMWELPITGIREALLMNGCYDNLL